MRKQKHKVLEQTFLVISPITKERIYGVGEKITLSDKAQIEFLKLTNKIK